MNKNVSNNNNSKNNGNNANNANKNKGNNPQAKWVGNLVKKMKNKKQKQNQINNAINKSEKSGVDKLIKSQESQSAMQSYVRMITSEQFITAVPKPLLSMGRSHIKKVKYRAVRTVNAQGRLLAVCPYALLSGKTTTAQLSPFLFMNSDNYDPTVNTNNITTGSTFDLGITSPDGTGLLAGHFASVCVIAGHLCASLSGVSNLNKKGKIYLAEGRNSQYYYGGSTSYAYATTLANRYYLGNMIKYQSAKEVEIMNMDSSSKVEYHYIDEHPYSTPHLPDPDSATTEHTTDGSHKAVILVVDGATPGTEVILDFTIVLQARPEPAYLNTYPTQNSKCFINPDPICRMLEIEPDNVLTVDNKRDNFGFAK
jgi:hypothetical protein